jgi:predicted O-methyltransferase YrrM
VRLLASAAVLIDAVKRALYRAGKTTPGQQAVQAIVLRDPRLAQWESVKTWPGSIDGFEDLALLFSSNRLNHGIATLQIDEAALLYRLAHGVPAGSTVAEIGRFKGGSTLLLAAALPESAHLYSYDLHAAVETDVPGAHLDDELRKVLARYRLEPRVDLVVGNSHTVEHPPGSLALLFVDGDHSYDGVRADWLHWRDQVAPGGHLLFHDAVDTGGYSTSSEGVVRLVSEIERDGSAPFERQQDAGAIAHFVRRTS